MNFMGHVRPLFTHLQEDNWRSYLCRKIDFSYAKLFPEIHKLSWELLMCREIEYESRYVGMKMIRSIE